MKQRLLIETIKTNLKVRTEESKVKYPNIMVLLLINDTGLASSFNY